MQTREDSFVRVVQLVAADRWTGAAATALQLASALREAGVDCHFAFRPGRGLEQRLQGLSWCHPILVKERTLLQVWRAVRQVRQLVAGMDVVHCHLPHDHLLARLACRERGKGEGARAGSRPVLVRSVRHPGHLKPHLFHRWLFVSTQGLGLANSAMLPLASQLPHLAEVPKTILPVALEPAFFGPLDRQGARQRLGVPGDVFVAGTIGKLDGTRGQEEFIRALATTAGVHGIVIGKGEALGRLQALAQALGVAERLRWAGYVEEGREHVMAAMDIFVFPAAGSDWGHRAIAEASACGLPTLAVDVPGVRDLVEPGMTGELFPVSDVSALARLLAEWAADPQRCRDAGRLAAKRASQRWTSQALAAAALGLYQNAGVAAPESRNFFRHRVSNRA